MGVINRMGPVAVFEEKLVAGGWEPVWPDQANSSQASGEAQVEWSGPMTKAAVARLLLDSDDARARDFDKFVEAYSHEVEPLTGYKWKIRLDTLPAYIRQRFEA